MAFKLLLTRSYTKKYILSLDTHVYVREIKNSPNYVDPSYLWVHSDISNLV